MVSQAAVACASARSQLMALSIHLSLRVVYSASTAKCAQTSLIRTLQAAPAAQHGFVGAAGTRSCARRCVRTTRRTVAICSTAAPWDSCTIRTQTYPQNNNTCTVNYTLTKYKFTPLLLMQNRTLKYSEGWHGDATGSNTLIAPGFLVSSCAWVHLSICMFTTTFALTAATD